MPLVQTRGAASAQGFGEFAQATSVNYIEDVFSTYLYTGNGTSQTITNGIDLSTKGGLVWFKNRNSTNNHALYDTARGATNRLSTSQTGGTGAQVTDPTSLTAFNSNGFSIGSDNSQNENTFTFASWTFRKQPKFFDVVTYTGTGVARTVAHNLGSVPGCIIVKRTDTAGFDWIVYHRSTGNTNRLLLNDTVPAASGTSFWNDTTPTSTVFTVGTNVNGNASGGTYIAYIFAHDAGGFGLTGLDNVISCGSFTPDGSGAFSVNLGYEPQWIMYKRTDSATVGNWYMVDNMRGLTAPAGLAATLWANTTDQEFAANGNIQINATGFSGGFVASSTVIYIAIRRGPMKVPTDATKVFEPTAYTGNGNTGRTISTVLSPTDLVIMNSRNSSSPNRIFTDRLRGSGTGENSGNMRTLTSTTTVEESASSLNGYYATLDFQTSVRLLGSSSGVYNNGSVGYILYSMKRAPSFFDEVCYTGTGSATTFSHNLAAVPEMMIVKIRTPNAYNWYVYHNALGNDKYAELNLTRIPQTSTNVWNDLAPTASVFNLGTNAGVNESGSKFVNYLFATCAGVSKVGSYTGTGTTQTINCGFTAGSRFILIKRTDSTGDWYVWDSARGIVAGNDPYLLLNSTAAEVTGTDYVDTANSGFEISSTAPAAINANGGTFIFLAIA